MIDLLKYKRWRNRVEKLKYKSNGFEKKKENNRMTC